MRYYDKGGKWTYIVKSNVVCMTPYIMTYSININLSSDILEFPYILTWVFSALYTVNSQVYADLPTMHQKQQHTATHQFYCMQFYLLPLADTFITRGLGLLLVSYILLTVRSMQIYLPCIRSSNTLPPISFIACHSTCSL